MPVTTTRPFDSPQRRISSTARSKSGGHRAFEAAGECLKSGRFGADQFSRSEPRAAGSPDQKGLRDPWDSSVSDGNRVVTGLLRPTRADPGQAELGRDRATRPFCNVRAARTIKEERSNELKRNTIVIGVVSVDPGHVCVGRVGELGVPQAGRRAAPGRCCAGRTGGRGRRRAGRRFRP